MFCDERKNLTALLDGELDPLEAERLRSHVESCAQCRRELGLLKRSYDALEYVEPFELAAGFAERVRSRTRRRSRLSAAAMVAAAVVVAAVVFFRPGGTTQVEQPSGETVQSQVASAEDLAPEERAAIENMDILEDYEILSELDLLAQFDTLEQFDEFPEIEAI